MIPLATTTIAVERPRPVEPYETPSTSTVASGVRAHISAPTGLDRHVGGQQERVDARLACDPVDLAYTDRVLDEGTGERYEVVWTQRRQGLGLDHTVAGLRVVKGLA